MTPWAWVPSDGDNSLDTEAEIPHPLGNKYPERFSHQKNKGLAN